jgi:hypothetical protein
MACLALGVQSSSVSLVRPTEMPPRSSSHFANHRVMDIEDRHPPDELIVGILRMNYRII